MGRYALKRRWLAIPFYVPYVFGRTSSYLGSFVRALARLTPRPLSRLPKRKNVSGEGEQC